MLYNIIIPFVRWAVRSSSNGRHLELEWKRTYI